MTWRRVVAAAVVGVGLAGCEAVRPNLVAGQPVPASSARAAEPSGAVRLQKTDVAPAGTVTQVSVLDLAGAQFPRPPEGQVAARIRATVNGVAILEQEVFEAAIPQLSELRNLPEPERGPRQKEIMARVLDLLIEREIILQDFNELIGKRRPKLLDELKEIAGKEFDKKVRAMKKQLGVKSDEDFQLFLRSQGLTLEGMRRQDEREFIKLEYMRNLIIPKVRRVGPEQIRDYYDTHPEEFQTSDSVVWQDIFLDASRFADRITARQFAEQLVINLRAGADFRRLALQYDHGDSSYRNGEGYGRRRGEIKPPEVEPILFQLREGQIGDVIELPNGYHIVKVIKREYAGRMPFDEKTQTAIRNKLQGQIWEREYKRLVENLKSKASIQYALTAP